MPPEKVDELVALCASEGVEATVIGQFVPTGRLVLKYHGQQVADLSMEFLHGGRPAVVREAVCERSEERAFALPGSRRCDFTAALLRILGSLNVCSKEWIIRQYDHEVQAGSVIKPLVGVVNDGPSDAAVLRPVLKSRARNCHRLRHESALRRLRPLLDGRLGDRRSGAELRGRRRRSEPDRDSR